MHILKFRIETKHYLNVFFCSSEKPWSTRFPLLPMVRVIMDLVIRNLKSTTCLSMRFVESKIKNNFCFNPFVCLIFGWVYAPIIRRFRQSCSSEHGWGDYNSKTLLCQWLPRYFWCSLKGWAWATTYRCIFILRKFSSSGSASNVDSS